MTTLDRVRPGPVGLSAPRAPHFLRELLTFGFVGTIGTIITIGGANLLRLWTGDSPVTTTLIPTAVATLVSYVANRHWTFRHRDSAGSGLEVAVFFGLNTVGALIQASCIAVAHYTLGLHDTLSYNVALLIGLGLGAAFRYWSYKKWVFTPAAA